MPLRFDPVTILTDVVENAGIWGILAIGFTLVLFVGILAMRARLVALALLFVAMCFSNFREPIGTVAVAVRWLSLLCLVPLSLPAVMKQGRAVLFIWIYALLSVAFAVRSPDFFWSFQRGFALVLLIMGASGSLQMVLNKGVRYETLFKGIVVMAVIWAVLNVLPLGAHLEAGGEERFAGEATSTGYNALVMGLLLPFALWGALHKWPGVWRVVSAAAAAMLVILLILGATRGGAFLGAIACIPLLLRISFKRLAMGALVLILIAGSAMIALRRVDPIQQRFIYTRYIGFSGRDILTGRGILWRAGLGKCLESPWMGHGSGTATLPRDREGPVMITTFHNAYLTSWYECSIFGMVAFIVALFVTIRRGLMAVIRSRGQPELQLAARTVLGTALGLGAVGLVETTIAGATNLFITMYLMTMVLIQNLWIQTSPAHLVGEALPQGEYQLQPYASGPTAEAF